MHTIEPFEAKAPLCRLIGEPASRESLVITLSGTPCRRDHLEAAGEAAQRWNEFDERHGCFADEHSTL